MIGTIVTSMERGQITLPKIYRDKLGIVPGVPLNVVLRDDEIVVKPLKAVLTDYSSTIKPKIPKKTYLKLMKEMKGVYWTKEDDKAKEEMEKKERHW